MIRERYFLIDPNGTYYAEIDNRVSTTESIEQAFAFVAFDAAVKKGLILNSLGYQVEHVASIQF